MDEVYASVASEYFSKGWWPLPLPPRKKSPPPDGWTGYNGHIPSRGDVQAWIETSPKTANIALRLRQDVLGIDVDMYDGKAGAQTMRDAGEKFGPLPTTAYLTSRTDGSGIRFYRIPEGLAWPNVVGPGVETIRFGHRYAVAAPSVHPDTGAEYRWLTELNSDLSAPIDIPKVDDLPELPEAWIVGLTKGAMEEVAARGEVTHDLKVSSLSQGMPCAVVEKKLRDGAKILASAAGSRHDQIRDVVLSLLLLGDQGHAGVADAITRLHEAWMRSVGADRPRDADREFMSIVEGAFPLVAGARRPKELCQGPACGGVGKFAPAWDGPPYADPPAREEMAGEVTLEDAVFGSRPELAHILAWARYKMVSPWAVLGVTLVRVTCATSPLLVLPAIIGSPASLNMFVGLVGPSGSGKGAAQGLAHAIINMPEVFTIGIGSGEGLVKAYARHVPPRNGLPGGMEWLRNQVIFTAAEVDTVAALKGRSGATLMPKLRQAWSGEALGFAYADQEKALTLDPHSYRMGLIVGIQPEQAQTLLDEAGGGTPQRFLWMPSTDPGLVLNAPEPPAPYDWYIGGDQEMAHGTDAIERKGRWWRAMRVCDTAVSTIRHAHIQRQLGQDALDGHSLLCRLKTAAALALLGGRYSVSDEDWALAGLIMAKSDATRAEVLGTISQKKAKATKAKAKEAAAIATEVEEAHEARVVSRLGNVIMGKLADGEWHNHGDLRAKIAARDRDQFEYAVQKLMDEGLVQGEEFVNARKRSGMRYHLK